MFSLLWLIPALPLAAFTGLLLLNRKLSARAIAITGTLPVGLSALLSIITGIRFLASPPAGYAYEQRLWTWFSTGAADTGISLYLDPLSLIFTIIISFVGFLIHLYSTRFMKGEEGYARFFSYMNLFVASMILLVLAGNLVFLYLGWEAVGLCSYLLIGFWYQKPENGYAARKAFIVTRIGDTMMAVGLFMIFKHLGTLNIQEVLTRMPEEFAAGSTVPVVAATMLLGGAIGKSAQLPLHIWLPDAMAGPSPVSALIHAATMVTAGVYLIARSFTIFELAPVIRMLTAIIGAITLLLAGLSALTQKDIKRVLAYSTISQIGYMFLALGVGAYTSAVFHFFTHAFFKALLFLAAGVIIQHMHHEHDMFQMGGLRKFMPFTFITFLAGAASLAALPLVTAGFYSKDTILWYAWSGHHSTLSLWLAGLAGSFITALYAFRMVFITFYGNRVHDFREQLTPAIKIPLAVLAAFSIIAGFINLPENMGKLQWFSGFLHHALPHTAGMHDTGTESLMQVISSLVVLSGSYLAYHRYLIKGSREVRFRQKSIFRLWQQGWYADKLYHALVVRPVVWLSRINEKDALDQISTGIARFHMLAHKALAHTQNGRLRWYAMGIATGVILAMIMVMIA